MLLFTLFFQLKFVPSKISNHILKQKKMENQVFMPRIGEQAPEFTSITTQGTINFPKDYEGKWVIFFSHPADFTPVCTSEFMTFANMEKQFNEANCELDPLLPRVSAPTPAPPAPIVTV